MLSTSLGTLSVLIHFQSFDSSTARKVQVWIDTQKIDLVIQQLKQGVQIDPASLDSYIVSA